MKQQSFYILNKHEPLAIIMQESPRAVELLSEYGIHCISCFFNEFDTLQNGAQMHGMTEEEMDEMISEINTQLEKEWRKKQKISKS